MQPCSPSCGSFKRCIQGRAPNTRMQRTRSSPSALRSPLMRCPLGGTKSRNGGSSIAGMTLKRRNESRAIVDTLEHLQKEQICRSESHGSLSSAARQNTFERAYTQDHVPMVTAQNFKGMQKFVASRVVGTADGSAPPFYRVAELHFPSMEALKAAVASLSAQRVVAHAISISSGGPPIVLVGGGRDEDLLACRLTRGCSGLAPRFARRSPLTRRPLGGQRPK